MPKSNKPVVIITGVSSGIGLETAKLFSSKGWLVVGTVRSREFPETLATHAVDTQLAEMTKPADLERIVQRTKQTYGRLDAVVANAGYGLWGRLAELTYEQMMDQLAVNVGAVAELIRLAIPQMPKGGVIIALSSVVGAVGLPEAPMYAASKRALEGLMESMWFDEGMDGIRLRLVEPGPIDSPFWKNRVAGDSRIVSVARRKILTKPGYAGAGSVGGSSTIRVAEIIYRAAMSSSKRLRYPVGNAVRGLILARRWLPESIFRQLIRRYYERQNKSGV